VAVVSSGETAVAPSTDAADGAATTAVEEATAAAPPPPPPPPPKVKPVKEAPVGFNTGVYSETEERAFVEALDIFGRNWRSVSSRFLVTCN
jgi:protein MYSM1